MGIRGAGLDLHGAGQDRDRLLEAPVFTVRDPGQQKRLEIVGVDLQFLPEQAEGLLQPGRSLALEVGLAQQEMGPRGLRIEGDRLAELLDGRIEEGHLLVGAPDQNTKLRRIAQALHEAVHDLLRGIEALVLEVDESEGVRGPEVGRILRDDDLQLADRLAEASRDHEELSQDVARAEVRRIAMKNLSDGLDAGLRVPLQHVHDRLPDQGLVGCGAGFRRFPVRLQRTVEILPRSEESPQLRERHPQRLTVLALGECDLSGGLVLPARLEVLSDALLRRRPGGEKQSGDDQRTHAHSRNLSTSRCTVHSCPWG